VYGVGCMVYGVWCRVSGVGCRVYQRLMTLLLFPLLLKPLTHDILLPLLLEGDGAWYGCGSVRLQGAI